MQKTTEVILLERARDEDAVCDVVTCIDVCGFDSVLKGASHSSQLAYQVFLLQLRNLPSS